MQQPHDETDGTPEWAKRILERDRESRAGLRLLMLALVVPLFALYQIYLAIAYGEVWRIPGRQHYGPVKYAEEPGRFLVGLGIAVFVILIWIAAIALYSRVRRIPDRQQ